MSWKPGDGKPTIHTKKYKPDVVRRIQWMYVISAILWILLLFMILFQSREKDEHIPQGAIAIGILVVPLLLYGISYSNARYITEEQEQRHWRGDYLTFASVTILIIVNWCGERKQQNYRVILAALLLLMLSLVEVWTKPEDQPVVSHSRGSFQTAGLTLLAYSLYRIYAVE